MLTNSSKKVIINKTLNIKVNAQRINTNKNR